MCMWKGAHAEVQEIPAGMINISMYHIYTNIYANRI